jgi:hypothetical protein
MPEGINGAALGRKIAQMLEDTAREMLQGVPPEKYPGAVERYRVLTELNDFILDRIDAQKAAEAKGEILEDD